MNPTDAAVVFCTTAAPAKSTHNVQKNRAVKVFGMHHLTLSELAAAPFTSGAQLAATQVRYRDVKDVQLWWL